MKKIAISLLALVSVAVSASPAIVFYPQAEGVQVIYENVYVGYSNKSKDETTTRVNPCTGGTCTSVEREWFDYNVQVGAVIPTSYGISPFAGLTYSNDKSHEDISINGSHYTSYDHSDNTVGFEAGVLYEFYPHALAGLKFSTQYEEVQFGLGYKF